MIIVLGISLVKLPKFFYEKEIKSVNLEQEALETKNEIQKILKKFKNSSEKSESKEV